MDDLKILIQGMCVLAIFATATPVFADPLASEEDEVLAEPKIKDDAIKYKKRYSLESTSTKLTNNRGEGSSRLYGTRNFRVVLHGVLYRGGANNRYFHPRRSNMNPLPRTGLENLCKEDFSTAVYLYSYHYSRAPKTVSCNPRISSGDHTLKYKQYSPLYNERAILQLVYDRIKGRLDGPIYTHCWNGWHASGLMSGMALKQFCGWNNQEVMAYWYKNTDGNYRGYSKVRRKLRNFKPLPEFRISKSEQAAICPSKVGIYTEGEIAQD